MRWIILMTAFVFTTNALGQTPSKAQFEQINKALQSEKDPAKKANLLYLAAHYRLEQEASKKNIDSVLLLNKQLLAIGKAQNSKKHIAQSMLLAGQIAIKQADTVRAMTLKSKALDYARTNELPRQEADVYRSIAVDLPYDKLPEKTKNFNKAIALYKQSGATLDVADAFNKMAEMYAYNEDVNNCIKYTLEAVKVKKSIKSYDLYKEYTTLAENYGILGDYQNTLKIALAAEKIALHLKADEEWLFHIYNVLGVVNSEIKFDLKAIEYYRKAIAVAKNNPHIEGLYDVTINTAFALYHIRKPAEALEVLLDLGIQNTADPCGDIRYTSILLLVYADLKQYDKAELLYHQLMQCDNGKPQYRVVKEIMYHAMIKYLLNSGQAKKTYVYIDKLAKMAEKSNDLLSLAELERTYYKSDSATGNYLSAMKHLQRFKKVSDSAWNAKKATQFADLQIKYETEKKDKDIKLLKQKGSLQEAKIRNATLMRYAFIGGLVILALFVALLYNRSRIRKQNNQKLELKQQKINEQNEQLRKLLTEKEWLLKEIHHRVKNNLQTVISLLNTQSTYLENKDALMAIQNSQHRMQAISLIHQKLYQSDDLGYIDMSWYINQLINNLKESFNFGQKIRCELDADPIKLDVSQAVPLGLILNEAISNAIKYAFEERTRGHINISLKNIGPDTYRLIIADDGVGLPEDFQDRQNDSLGMHLMVGLTEQIEGTFELQNNNGLSIIVIFTKKKEFTDEENLKITLNNRTEHTD
ncbi:histidine kinase dimerization/phosphoacceptor domain -containing protein [Flavobacterium sp.]|uniref:tetratricopeptide repeat-containing sensor histidine kinase n=1 Tax=Flavobacterium sp. TaxID=239 RepID=UPI0039E269D7